MNEESILKYQSDVWATADLLRGAGIKTSDFPKFMMPFFALILVESRLIRHSTAIEKEVSKEDIEEFEIIFKNQGFGYNDYVIRENKSLKEICKNDKTIQNDFDLYLNSFDYKTKKLLGVNHGSADEKFLDISGITSLLQKKGIAFQFLKAWSEIDLTGFNNSEITTLEEHIKRKWADISAETAGEQYTPDDIISLISEIIVSKTEDNEEFLTIYDPTCGGGNLLFGVEDKLMKAFPNRPTATYGEEWNDALYALASIESRFRVESEIKQGNTLTNTYFADRAVNVIVANPPYGVDWKGYQSDIKNDETGRFIAYPSISDGQFLFTQHIISYLGEQGLAVVVHNGSTLFSGDAGSGESNIRKYFFEQDFVEAIIQMPTDEFFNTSIYTYLWIFNKNKAKARKDKVILINASELYEPLKKSKGKKRKQMNLQNRKTIIEAFTEFKDNDFAKVFDKWHFYYNKQSIQLCNIDTQGKAIELPSKKNKQGELIEAKSIKLIPTEITQVKENETITIKDFVITDFDTSTYKDLKDYFEKSIKPQISQLDYKEQNLRIKTEKASYYYAQEQESIIEEIQGKKQALGAGKIVIKASFKKATKTKEASIAITAELTKDLQKDYEIIPYSPIESQNQENIAKFMEKYISKPFKYIDNVVGAEINFNKVFYKAEHLRPLQEITQDLEDLNKELALLEEQLKL